MPRKREKKPGLPRNKNPQQSPPGTSPRLEELPTQSLRLNRILSLAGVTSRRKADELIQRGRVSVNGEAVTEPGVKAVWGKDSIRLDGEEIPRPQPRIYLLLNKPFGYVSSLSDPEGRPVVSNLLRGIEERVYPVGRLDFDTLGLLLLTNDGDLAFRLAHPRYRVPRTYKATVEGKLLNESLDILRKGVHLEDGFSGPAKVTLIQKGENRSMLRMTITRGKSRLIRRMLEATGHEVIHLLRTGFGTIELGDLKVGAFRHLETSEVEELKRMVGLA